jgi:SpoVK/Ycf46/Vps4 family AAA+-type ATPase
MLTSFVVLLLGTGKTLLAKTLAAEIGNITKQNISFFYHKGGESFSMFFGEAEQNLTRLFAAAKRHKPSIIFFDEIDGLCPDRVHSGQSSQAYASIVTCMLGLIDSVKRGEVFLIGATNRVS